MSTEDKLVWRILCTASLHQVNYMSLEDEEDSLDHISVFEFTTNYKKYAKSFRRFRVTAEEFFVVLHEANKKNEVV